MPDIFATALAYTAVSAVLGRKYYFKNKIGTQFLPSFRLLITPPGVGKTISIKQLRACLKQSHLPWGPVPDSITAAALLDVMSDPRRKQAWGRTALENIQVGTLITDEYRYTAKHMDNELTGLLCKLWDGEDVAESRRGQGRKGEPLEVKNPYFNILAATQNENFNELFTPQTWGSGYNSRFVFYVCEEVMDRENPFDLSFEAIVDDEEFYRTVGHDLQCIHARPGIEAPVRIGATPEAHKWLAHYWTDLRKQTAINLETMAEYNERRALRLMIDACLNAICRADFDGKVTLPDLEFVYNLHLELEERLAILIRRGTTSTDGNVLKEIVDWMKITFLETKAPLSKQELMSFITGKVDANKARTVYNNLKEVHAMREVDEMPVNGNKAIMRKLPVPVIIPNMKWTSRFGGKEEDM